MTTTSAHISDICAGDLVLHDGKIQTVCVKDLKHDPCMGRTLFGDSYHLGHKPVMRVRITTPKIVLKGE